MTTSAFVLALALTAAVSLGAIKTQTVEYKQGDTTLKGFLAYDDAVQGKRPGVIVVHEWWGLNDYPKMRAQELAKLGYVALAADMYGDGKNTTDAKEAGSLAGKVRQDRQVGRQRMQAALDQLRAQPTVDGSKIAAIGYCFGGSTVLDFALSGADISAVVSFHGSLGSLPWDQAKSIKATVLICNGASDTAVPDKDKQAAQQALTQANIDWCWIDYGGAVHAFTNPNAGKANMGGNVAYNEQADKRSWQAMRDQFNEVFGASAMPK